VVPKSSCEPGTTGGVISPSNSNHAELYEWVRMITFGNNVTLSHRRDRPLIFLRSDSHELFADHNVSAADSGPADHTGGQPFLSNPRCWLRCSEFAAASVQWRASSDVALFAALFEELVAWKRHGRLADGPRQHPEDPCGLVGTVWIDQDRIRSHASGASADDALTPTVVSPRGRRSPAR
jgi:hypothetical protein